MRSWYGRFGRLAAVALVLVAAGCHGTTGPSAAPSGAGAPGTPAPEGSPPVAAPPGAGAGGQGSAGSSSPSAPAPVGAAPLTVAQIAAQAPGVTGTIRGLFLGYRGPCRSAPPTRSAWQLADGDQPTAACLYVDGPMPAGVDPNTAPGAAIWVRVDARLEGSGAGRFLSARTVEREQP